MSTPATKTATPKPAPPAKKTATTKKVTDIKGKEVSPEGLTVGFEEITPEVARQMLERNTSNRGLREARIESIARDIRTGDFYKTHQGIAFDAEGTLIDGQHRLAAIVRAETPVVLQVTRGVPVAAKPIIDTGAKRTLSDVLRFGGYQNTANTAGVVRMHLQVERGTPMGNYGQVLTQAELVNHFEANEELMVTAGKLCNAWQGHISAPPSVVGTAWALFTVIDSEQAMQFFQDMINMTTAGEGDPRVALMHRLRRRAEANEKIPYAMLLNMFIKAWNSWRRGEPVTRISVDRLKTKTVLEAI